MAIYDDIFDRLLDGRFRIRKILGAGGFGTVFLASQEIFGTQQTPGMEFRNVAIKLFQNPFVAENAHTLFKEAVLLEQLAAGARNRGEAIHLVTVYDAGRLRDYRNTAYVAMEYVDGGSLSQYTRGGVPLKKTVELARQICAGLKLAHDRHVIHRDLKPDNVLFMKGGFLKLTDFGLAIDRIEAFAAANAGGTRGYIPPREPEALTPAFDVYSTGVLMLELLLGRNPLQQVLSAAPERTATVPDGAYRRLADLKDPATGTPLADSLTELRHDGAAQTILRSCLQVRAADRYPNAATLDADLQRWEQSKSVRPGVVRRSTLEDLLENADRQRKNGRLDEAEKYAAEARAYDATDARVHEQTARIHASAGRWQEAAAAMEQIRDATPAQLEVRASYLEKSGRTRAAAALRQQAARRAP